MPDSATRGSIPRPTQPTPFPETISVIITAWRRRRFLEEALGSVRTGARSPVELVVVSDFHNEDLEREVQGRQGKWVVSQEERWGAMIADGIRAARGSIIALLDDDDLFHPLRLVEVRRAFDQNPDLGFFHNGHVSFRDGEPPVFPETLPLQDWFRIPPGRRTRLDCERIWTEGAGYNGSSTVFRRSLLDPVWTKSATSGKAFRRTSSIAPGTRPRQSSWTHGPSLQSACTLKTQLRLGSKDAGPGSHALCQSRPTYLPMRRRFSRSSDQAYGIYPSGRWPRWGESYPPQGTLPSPRVALRAPPSSCFDVEESGFQDGFWSRWP